MTRAIPAVLMAAGTVSGVAGGEFIEGHTVSLATLAGIIAVVIPGTLYVGRQFQKLQDEIRELKEALDKLPCRKQGSKCKLDA